MMIKKKQTKRKNLLQFEIWFDILCLFGPMVKRLRRRPLKAESGVRFPLGLPI